MSGRSNIYKRGIGTDNVGSCSRVRNCKMGGGKENVVVQESSMKVLLEILEGTVSIVETADFLSLQLLMNKSGRKNYLLGGEQLCKFFFMC